MFVWVEPCPHEHSRTLRLISLSNRLNSSLASGTTSLPEGLFSKGVICQALLARHGRKPFFVVLVFAALVSPDQVNFKADEAHS